MNEPHKLFLYIYQKSVSSWELSLLIMQNGCPGRNAVKPYCIFLKFCLTPTVNLTVHISGCLYTITGFTHTQFLSKSIVKYPHLDRNASIFIQIYGKIPTFGQKWEFGSMLFDFILLPLQGESQIKLSYGETRWKKE